MRKSTATEVNEPTNGAKDSVEAGIPYIARVRIRGSSAMLFHRWNAEAVDEKAKAAKGSKAKKTDDLETYVYRDDDNNLCLPGEYLRMSMIEAAKYKQDPRSPRKSLKDLAKAAIISLTDLASLGTQQWDYEDKRRVMIQRNGINRTRPAMKAGWEAEFELMVNLPEYINSTLLNELVTEAGRLVGVGDFRPTFGRFQIVRFEIQ